jgi:hypothetical protein
LAGNLKGRIPDISLVEHVADVVRFVDAESDLAECLALLLWT